MEISKIKVEGIPHDVKDAVSRTNIGDMTKLNTANKGSLVDAINETMQSNGTASDTLYVTMTNNGDNTYTADKTADEVLEARNAGRRVICRIRISWLGNMDYELPLCACHDGVVYYGGASDMFTLTVAHLPDNTVDVWSNTLATQSYVDEAIANLPSGGSSAPKTMELIASGTNTEPVRRFKITADNDGNAFELTKMYLVVRNLVSNNTDGNQGISVDIQNTTSGLYASLINVALMTNEAKNKDVVAYANGDGLFMGFQGGGGIYSLGAPKFSTVFMPNQTITLVNFTCAAALQTFQAGATYELWGVRK